MNTAIIKMFGKETQVYLEPARYGNDRLAIEVKCCDDNSRWGVLTVNLPNAELEDDEIFVKNWSEQVWANQILEQLPELFEDTGKTQPSGFVEAPIWRVKQPLTPA